MTKTYYTYLCGPMAANTAEQASGWRNTATEILTPAGISVINPMRDVRDLHPGEIIGVDAEARLEKTAAAKANVMKGIVARDRFDVAMAHSLLANFTEIGYVWNVAGEKVEIPSTGSDIELGWAFEDHTIIVGVAPEGNHYRTHPFTTTMVDIWFDTLEPACDWIIRNSAPYRDEPNR